MDLENIDFLLIVGDFFQMEWLLSLDGQILLSFMRILIARLHSYIMNGLAKMLQIQYLLQKKNIQENQILIPRRIGACL